MTHRLAAVLFGLSLLGTAQEMGLRQSLEVTKTERVNFLPGGTIQVDNSYGYLTVEGWDEPAVEITVAKSTSRAESLSPCPGIATAASLLSTPSMCHATHVW
jgi:hypothetical protein